MVLMGNKTIAPFSQYVRERLIYFLCITPAMSPQHLSLKGLFNPSSLAVIGASHKEGKIGYILLNNIISSGYQGRVYPVNVNGGTALGMDFFTSLEELPEDIDLGIIIIPAKHVGEALEGCGRKGIKHVIIISSGFSEIGNADMEEELINIAEGYGIRILGPNVFGVYSSVADMNATFGPTHITKGNIALISQSGALGIAMIGMTAEQHLGLSSIVSVGNKSDIDDMDLIDYFSRDDVSDVIMIYMEGLPKGRKLLEKVRELPQEKTIVVIKAGRSEKGATAVASHTGSLAGSDKIFSAAFQQAGILRAKDLRQAFDWSRLISSTVLPEREKTVIITNGGGIGVLAADAAEEYGVPLLDDQTFLYEIFKDSIPPFGSTKNPVDLTGQAGRKEYERAMRAALESQEVGAVMGLYCETGITDPMDTARVIRELYHEYREKKPMVFTFSGGEFVNECVSWLRKEGVPAFVETDDAVSSMGALFRRKRYLDKMKKMRAREVPDMKKDEINEVIAEVRKTGRTNLLEDEARKIFELAGIPLVPGTVVSNLDDCIKAAEEIGYPVVLKVVSEDIIHKSDAGGLMLNLENRDELIDAYQAIYANCKRKYPDAHIRGVSVAKMLKGGEEVIVGGTNDPSFGPVVMFGLGGVYVEILKDVQFRVAPVSRREAHEMIGDINAFPVLVGARGQKRKDLDALADVVFRISHLMNEVDDISELDLNPVKALDQGDGCMAVDVRITLKREAVH